MTEKWMEQGLSRRNFLKTGVAAGALAGVGATALAAERKTATDMVALGRGGIKTTRLAFGTGSNSGRVQQGLGQDGFTRLVRYAYDRGIRFFETSESYGLSQQMLGEALKGLPRESYTLLSKVTTRAGVDPVAKLEELRQNSKTDYFDVMLLHVQHTPTRVEDTKHWQDAMLEAGHKQTIRSHGASVHGLPALRRIPGNEWLHVAMIRMNHTGQIMDAEQWDAQASDNIGEVVRHVQQIKREGIGVLSMKLIAEGAFGREDRQKAMRFAFRTAGVDCVTVGFKNNAEIDEAIENINLALA
ncbi:MAG: aldo/keto reductase [Terracidiphilus sp.]|nr:aldo/keto reductase [Terracidiphilus sp.]